MKTTKGMRTFLADVQLPASVTIFEIEAEKGMDSNCEGTYTSGAPAAQGRASYRQSIQVEVISDCC